MGREGEGRGGGGGERAGGRGGGGKGRGGESLPQKIANRFEILISTNHFS